MREVYTEQLAALAEQIAGMCHAVGIAIQRATAALLEADLGLAEQVISGDAEVDQMRAQAEEQAFALLALQAPVATDLRTVLSAIYAVGDLERMGDLAAHIAQAARRRHPAHAVPEQVTGFFAEMGRLAAKLSDDAEQVIRTRDVSLAEKIEEDDDAMDDLHRHLFTELMARQWPHGVQAAVDVTLLGRFYERFADHAVLLARRVVFVVTGNMPTRA
jgi:phosphate transport system protein